MASFLINSAAVAVTGTDDADTFQITTGGDAVTVDGLAGNDLVQASAQSAGLTDSFFYLREGDDTLTLVQSGGDLTNSFVGGALGDDAITLGSAGSEFIGNTVNGGQGEDTLTFDIGGTASGFSINGGRDDDTIDISAGAVSNGFIGLGKGDDFISAGFENGIADSSVAGGLGEDTLVMSANGDISDVVINGGGNGTDGSLDSADIISASADAQANNFTIVGNGGDDTIGLDINSGGGVVINGNLGDDFIEWSSDDVSSSTIGGGKGDDTIIISGGTVSGGVINGGLGTDLINISGGSAFVVAGGADADTIVAVETAGLAITNFSDSTLSDLDTVLVSAGGNASAGITVSTIGGVGVVADGTTAGTAGGNAVVVTAGGSIDFQSAGITTLTAAADFLDDNLSEKEAVIFTIHTAGSGGDVYLFTKGAADSDNMLVQMDMSAASAGSITAQSTTSGTDLIMDLA